MTRIAGLYVPMFPLAARLRSEPELREEAVVIVDGSGNGAHVVAATRRARVKGIHPGLSLAQARSILPKLIARGREPECERTAQDALVEVAETFSPRIENAGEGVVFFDVTGMERHFAAEARDGGEAVDPEVRLARAAIRAADGIGLPARCGIAASKLAARIAAELPKSPNVVGPGKEADFLSPLPLARLSPELDAAATLQRWGLSSIGELARLPESEIASRLGELGRELHVAARGIDPRPLIPRALPPEFREGMELEWPLVALEPFLFIAHAALDRLSLRLELQGFACRRLELLLTLEPDGFHSRAIDLPAPTRDVKTMLTLLRLELEQAPPGAPVVGFALTAYPDRPRRAQLSLFGPSALAPEKLATTIARLISILGENRVGMPVSIDGHLPERFAIQAFEPPAPPDVRRSPKKSHGILALRLFRPPIPVKVTVRDSGDVEHGRLQIESIVSLAAATAPVTAAAGGGRPRVEMGSKASDIGGPVRVSSGPWQVEEGWWTETPAAREYWDVELEKGGIYRLFHGADAWFIDARYD